MEEIRILITPDGKVKFHVQGVSGESCESLTRAIEEALGTETDHERTDEYYVTEKQRLIQR